MADNWFLAGQWDHDPDHRMADQQVQLEKSLLNGNEHLPGWNDRLLCCTELFYIIDWPLSASCRCRDLHAAFAKYHVVDLPTRKTRFSHGHVRNRYWVSTSLRPNVIWLDH